MIAKSHILPVEFRVASPERVTLGNIGDVMAYPLTIKDLGTIRHEARQRGRQREQDEAREKLKFLKEVGEDTPENKKEVLNYHNMRVSTGMAESNWMVDFEGTSFSIWMMIRKDKSDITLEQVREGMLHYNIDYWQNLIDRLSYPPTPEDDEKEEDKESKGAKGEDPNAEAPRPEKDAGETSKKETK